MSFYIYKYVYNDIVEYIGKTTNLEERIKQHTKDKLKNFNGKIYYFECPNKTAMTSWEYTLINKYHPRYNVALKDSKINIDVKEPEWILYMNTSIKTNNNIINFTDYLNSRLQKNTSLISKSNTSSNSRNTSKIFTCRHCRETFEAVNWYKTKTGFGATCPCCRYAAWTR